VDAVAGSFGAGLQEGGFLDVRGEMEEVHDLGDAGADGTVARAAGAARGAHGRGCALDAAPPGWHCPNGLVERVAKVNSRVQRTRTGLGADA